MLKYHMIQGRRVFDQEETGALKLNKADRLAEFLRLRVRGGHLRPGQRLPSERELALQSRTSRTTVREVLAALTAEGYLSLKHGPQGGAFVSNLEVPIDRWLRATRANMKAFEDLLDYRVAIDLRVADLAALRRTDEQLREIESAVDSFEAEHWTESLNLSNALFHDQIGRACGNRRLARASWETRCQIWILPFYPAYAECAIGLAEMHRRIYLAIRDRDPGAACAAMSAHIEVGRAELRAVLRAPATP
jgi:GntR family transcriptional regulator, transcriptional repressor for pyruvate dehydrogenase complex